jgi:hypothetical protein
MRRLVLTSALMACYAITAFAQETVTGAYGPYPKIEVFAGYAAIETNDHTFQFQNIGAVGNLDFDEKGKGIDVAVVANINKYLGIMGDFGAHFSTNQFQVPFCDQPPCPSSLIQGGEINPKMFNILAGPEVKWRNQTRLTPFAHGLLGVAHSTATFNTTGQVLSLSRKDAETGLAMAIDAGLDIRIIPQVSLRTSLGHGRAYLGSSALPAQRVGSARASTGVLFSF